MLAVVLLVAVGVALISVLLLVMVVVGIRQEPPNSALNKRAQRPTAALTRHLLGVCVRRPDELEDAQLDEHSFLAGQGRNRGDR
jgi:uncharacterized membrane protein (Fun14 family)